MPDNRKRGFRLPWMRDGEPDGRATQVLDPIPSTASPGAVGDGRDGDTETDADFGAGPFGIAAPPRAPRDLEAMRRAALDSRITDQAPPKWLQRPGLEISGETATTPGVPAAPTEEAHRSATETGGTGPRDGAHEQPHGEPVTLGAWPEADLATRDEPPVEPASGGALMRGALAARVATPSSAGSAADANSPAGRPAAAAPDPAAPAADLEAADDMGLAFGLERTAAILAEAPAGDRLGAAAADAVDPSLEGQRRAAARGAGTSAPTSAVATASRAVSAAATAAPSGHEGRRDNPLLTGLGRAMRESAKATREETTARLRAQAEARIAAIRSRSAADGASLRKQADEDQVAIREWSKAEMARVRAETAQRIEGRRAQLAGDSQALSSMTGRLVGEIEAAVSSFESEMKRFFKALLAEEDPAHLATLAEQMPEPPVLEALPEAVAMGIAHVSSAASQRRGSARPLTPTKRGSGGSTARTPGARRAGEAVRKPAPPRDLVAGAPDGGGALAATLALDSASAELAEAEALAGLDLLSVGGRDWSLTARDGSSNGSLPRDPARAELDGRASQTMRGSEPAGPAGERAEAGGRAATQPVATQAGATQLPATEPPAPDEDPLQPFLVEGQTRLILMGLSDQGLAAFERALRGVAGVGSVNVSRGGDGEVVFSVTHGLTTDLRAAVPDLPGFHARVTEDEGAILSIEARDPGR